MGEAGGAGDRDTYFTPTQVWNPTKRAVVNLPNFGSNPQTAQEYMQANAPDYMNYAGPVLATPNNVNIGADAFGINTGTRETPRSEYRTSYEKTQLNPYDTYNTQDFNKRSQDIVGKSQIAPGVRPNLGFLPGYGGVNMMNGFRPLEWDTYDQSRKGKNYADPFERQFLETLSQKGFKSPTFDQMSQRTGRPLDFGRGFHYSGQATPEEQQMVQMLQSGRPVDFNRFAQLRNARIKQNELSTMQKIAGRYYAPFLGATMGAMAAPAGVAGAAFGGALGAAQQGAQTQWKNPAAIGLGAAGGFAGGYGGGQLAGAMGAGPVVGGAMRAAGGSIGRNLGYGAGTGNIDTTKLLRDAGISAAAGGVTGALSPQTPRGQAPNFGGRMLAGMGGGAVGSALNTFLPGGPKPPSRQMTPQQAAAEKERQRRAQQQQRQLNPYR